MATLVTPAIDERRFERIDGKLVERPVANTIHMQVQRSSLKLLDQLLAETDAEVGQEWSITRPGHADKDDPDYMTADVLSAVYTRKKRPHHGAGISCRRGDFTQTRAGPD
jgi:hypothetical protein